MIIPRDFLEYLKYDTAKDGSTVMILRPVGPDGVSDAERASQIYSAYHVNLEPECPGLFDKLLYNEFVFVEFASEEAAYQFALENLPMNKDSVEGDYWIQFFIISNGEYYYSNDNLKALSASINEVDTF
jgi:hypothetical protein